MKKILFFSFALLMTATLVAQKQVNDANAQVRSVKNFHAIKVSHGIQLFLSQGGNEAVAVSASETEFRDKIITEVENGVLKIYYDYNFLKQLSDRRRKNLKAYVSFTRLDAIDGSSGARVEVDGTLKSDKLRIETSSGATFEGKVDANTLAVDQSSGSVMNINGSVNSLEVEGSSGSIFRGFELDVNECKAETSSGSGIQVTINKELSAEASSGGSISYKGAGVIRNIRTSSGGSVSRKS
ncbi:MAG TPA: head GIN domain-containing protein [Flavitalea sp.]|nr:head GIN domain-containing protein [Flavitalea sp.]